MIEEIIYSDPKNRFLSITLLKRECTILKITINELDFLIFNHGKIDYSRRERESIGTKGKF